MDGSGDPQGVDAPAKKVADLDEAERQRARGVLWERFQALPRRRGPMARSVKVGKVTPRRIPRSLRTIRGGAVRLGAKRFAGAA